MEKSPIDENLANMLHSYFLIKMKHNFKILGGLRN